MKRMSWYRTLLLLMVILLLAGCGGKHKLVAGAPDWVNRGSGAFTKDKEKAFYGVGAVTGISTYSLAVQAADQRARADIARQLETFVSHLYRDFQATVPASAGTGHEQHVEDTLKTMTQVSVRGARVIDHWRDPETNTVYSLARLDLEALRANVEKMQEIDAALRSFTASGAERAFDELRLQQQRR